MPPQRGVASPGYVIEHPNRDKASSHLVRFIVVLLLLASAVVMAIISYGGWDTIEGAKALQIAYILLYVLFGVMILLWKRGLLPVSSAAAIILIIFAAVSAPAWFDRDKDGFTNPTINEDLLGTLTYLLIPLQVAVIVFAMIGFAQAWNVEYERPIDQPPEDQRQGGQAPQQGGGAWATG